jgi:hypothetical protein
VLFATQVELPANTRITGFGAIKKSEAAARLALGLYSDSDGNPDTRISRTDSTVFQGSQLTIPARNEYMDCLAPGMYWLVGYAETAIDIGLDADGMSVASATSRLGAGAERALPMSWPAGMSGRGQPLNMWVTLDRP